MRNIGIDAKELSPYGCVYADKSGRNQIVGYHCMDQLKLFKDLTYQTQPSYSLNSIANVVLGKEKVKHEESIDDMYHDNIEKFMSYSQTDTQLIMKLNLKNSIYLFRMKLDELLLYLNKEQIVQLVKQKVYMQLN